jgi:hypothetical protein
MKMNSKLVKCLIVLFLLSINSENFGTNCAKTQMSASFKSNYKLMLEKKKTYRGGEGNNKAAQGAKIPSDSSISITGNDSSSGNVATGFITKQRKVLVPDVPILFQGWAKYFYYLDKGNSKPNNFFINDEFDHQSQEEKNDKSKDKVRKLFK